MPLKWVLIFCDNNMFFQVVVINGLGGVLSDSIGRRKTILLFSAIHVLFSFLTSISQTYLMFVGVRFFVGGCIHSEGEDRLLVQAGKKVLTDDHSQHHHCTTVTMQSTGPHMVADIIHQTLTIFQLINTDHHLLISISCYSVFTVFI